MSQQATTTPTTADPAPPTRAPSSPVPLAPALGFAAVVGPLLVLTSSLIWLAGAEEMRFAIQFLGAILVAFGFVGVCVAVAERAPRTGSVLAVLILLGFGAGGTGFAVDGLHEVLFGSASLAETDGLAPAIAPTVTGLVGPLSMLAIGIAVLRTRALPMAAGALLVVAAVAFPVSRVGGIAPLAVVVDLLLVAALVPVGVRLWRTGRPEA